MLYRHKTDLCVFKCLILNLLSQMHFFFNDTVNFISGLLSLLEGRYGGKKIG